MDLVVENEDKSSSSSSENVGEASLEESSSTFVLVDLLEAIKSSIIHLISTSLSGSHHESSSDSVEWVGNNTGSDSDDLSETPHSEEVSSLDVLEEKNLTSIEHTEVRGSVTDDTNDRDTETSVESEWTVLGGNLLKAIN